MFLFCFLFFSWGWGGTFKHLFICFMLRNLSSLAKFTKCLFHAGITDQLPVVELIVLFVFFFFFSFVFFCFVFFFCFFFFFSIIYNYECSMMDTWNRFKNSKSKKKSAKWVSFFSYIHQDACPRVMIINLVDR